MIKFEKQSWRSLSFHDHWEERASTSLIGSIYTKISWRTSFVISHHHPLIRFLTREVDDVKVYYWTHKRKIDTFPGIPRFQLHRPLYPWKFKLGRDLKKWAISIEPLSQGRGTVFYPTLQLGSFMIFKQQRLDINNIEGELADLWFPCLSKVSSNCLLPRYVTNDTETDIKRKSRVCKLWFGLSRTGFC